MTFTVKWFLLISVRDRVFFTKEVFGMVVKNTKESRRVKNVVATMALENMYLSKDFIDELLKVSKGEKSSEQLRQEVLSKYAK